MTLDNTDIALQRFGYGPRPNEWENVSSMPRLWATNQVQSLPPIPSSLRNMAGSHTVLQRSQQGQIGRNQNWAMHKQESGLWIKAAAASDVPFFMRWVRFWVNHFAVSIANQNVRGLAGCYLREAIWPNALGTFHDMLRASARHPAMLIYLDNANSVGPNSSFGQRSGRGLNENLAREILELHTLGVNGGYSQTDVTEFAKIITGWTVNYEATRPEDTFRYQSAAHEPDQKRFLGERYGRGSQPIGEAEGEAALEYLSNHRSTANFVATKLARHFVADDPPPAAISTLVSTFNRTDGNLKELALVLAQNVTAWQNPLSKIKSHQDYLISMIRSTNANLSPEVIWQALEATGQAPFSAPAPTGWGDTAGDWIGPEAILRRVDMARIVAQNAPRNMGSSAGLMELAQNILRTRLTPRTSFMIEGAESPEQALIMLLASPEFQAR